MKLISIMTPCYNEEDNVELVYTKIKDAFSELKNYAYEHIFIDNASTDRTAANLKNIAQKDKNVKIIINSRNFGWIRSPFYALLQTKGDAVIIFVADLQDPPELIKDFIAKWESGYKIVVGSKKGSEEPKILLFIRKVFYNFIAIISEVRLLKNFTGFGLYDREIIEILRGMDEQYPYFRGLISEIGFDVGTVEYVQPARKKGAAKGRFYALYDMAMTGITSHSKLPLRLATMLGFATAFLSLLVALGYLIYKLLFWQTFSTGTAPIVIGLFFFSAVQLFFIGIVGEYIGAIYTRVQKRPLVIERERINF